MNIIDDESSMPTESVNNQNASSENASNSNELEKPKNIQGNLIEATRDFVR